MAATTPSDYRHLPQQDQSLPLSSAPLYNNPPAYRTAENDPPGQSTWLPLRHVVVKFWNIESLASFFSLALFGAIAAILAVYDRRRYSVSSALNLDMEMKRAPIYPILAILSTVMRACMLLPVAACIDQLKWSWFQKPRELVGIESFDQASHSVTGSLILLCMVRLRHLVAVGAALIILALPVDAVIQSSLSVTGDFDFGSFQTLAINSHCVDRSGQLENHTEYLKLPDADLRFYDKGRHTDGYDYDQMLIAVQSYPNQHDDTLDERRVQSLITRTVVIVKPDDIFQNAWRDPIALECFLKWSIRTISGTFNQANGSSLVDSTLSEAQSYGEWNVDGHPANATLRYVLEPKNTTGCWVKGTEMKPDKPLYSEECLYRVTNPAHNSLQ
ncbi:hypothetical protein DM02DRAFT_700057 [Periconia macrospinosa]|uniref:Uncharacterized protein n=1 Tax=Periconia macrospinosa TaxID=97972 RepID=A0A2V1D300_9PLEO|nr:hypothetical protein DM02DRAFT_700057 [Periconia macrospinosa]